MEVQIEEKVGEVGAKIKVIGVGGGGSNMVSYLMQLGIDSSIELIVANTDAQALMKSPARIRVQLGNRLTRGLGAGMKPEVGRDAALESYDDLKSLLEGTDMVFISAGLGGGTGTGAAPIIAKAAKEVGALTVAVVTKPFAFEAGKRSKLAEAGLIELKKETDSIVVIPNDKLSSIVDKSQGFKETFKMVDAVLARAVDGMSRVILRTGEGDINVDFADVCTVMSYKGLALMGMGESSGSNAAFEAIKNAIESPLFDNISINGAKGLLASFHFHPLYSFHEVSTAMKNVEEYLDDDADVFFGTYTDESMPQDRVEVTIVATGFEREDEKPMQLTTPEVSETKQPSSQAAPTTPIQSNINIRRVSGGDYAQNSEELDLPAIFRKQMD